MENKLEKHRTLLAKKQARLAKLKEEVDSLAQLVQEEENVEIVAAVRTVCLSPERLTAFLKELRQSPTATLPAEAQTETLAEDNEEDISNEGNE